MPCGPGKVVYYEIPAEEDDRLVSRLREKIWFGFAQVDIRVLRELWEKCEEFPPLFTTVVFHPRWFRSTWKSISKEPSEPAGLQNDTFCRRLAGIKILLYAPLLGWYLDHGLEITAVHRTIDYRREKIFTWFVNKVTENRRRGDEDPDKALLAEVFKLLGNSATES